jgi:hypothetical protein
LTKKFARRFVMVGIAPNVSAIPMCGGDNGDGRSVDLAEERTKGRITMRKTILSLVGAALLATVTFQFAVAAERHQAKAKATTAPAAQQFRNSNAAWPAQPTQPDVSRYSGGYSAPAGR